MRLTEQLQREVGTYQRQAKDILFFLIDFIKNPVMTIKHIPDWPWPQLILSFIVIAAITGTVSGILVFNIGKIFSGMILFPIASLLVGLFLSGFFYYTFLFVFQNELRFKKIFTIVTLSLIPFFALYTLSAFVPLLQLVGFALTGILLVVGFSENTRVNRKKMIKIVVALYLIYALFTALNLIKWESDNQSFKDTATPDTLKQLEKEFK